MYPHKRVTIPLKTCRFNHSYGHKFSFFNFIFSKRYEYTMSQELSPSIRTLETSKLAIMVVITKGKISFGISQSSRYHRIWGLASLWTWLRAIYWCFPMCPSSPPLSEKVSTIFLGDCFFFRDFSYTLFSSLMYSSNLPFFIITSIALFTLTQSFMLWPWLLWKRQYLDLSI